MNLSALLTSAGINIAVCVGLLSLYSILRKQPSFLGVYFGQRLAQVKSKHRDHFFFDRLIPSASWIVNAWKASEEEIYAVGGMDAVVFLRVVVFSIRIVSIAATICMFLVLPLNYMGKAMQNKNFYHVDGNLTHLVLDNVIHSVQNTKGHSTHNKTISVSVDLLTIANVDVGSKWLWAHCLALYLISCSACILLYLDNKRIMTMRLEHIRKSASNLSDFTVLVRGIPWSSKESYSEAVENFFKTYYASNYLSHQIIYRCGTVQKLMSNAQKICNMVKSTLVQQCCSSNLIRCAFCGGTTNCCKLLMNKRERVMEGRNALGHVDLKENESSAALVFFKTRYAALVASLALQSANTRLWKTELAPEPTDVHWKSLVVPYKLLWVRRVATLLASVFLTAFYLLPVGLVQGLVNLDNLQERYPILKSITQRKVLVQFVTGYLPSVVLMLFMYIIPPIMLLFSTIEGSISRSSRKKSATVKVIFFYIWNVFFANVVSGTVLDRLKYVSEGTNIFKEIAKAVPTMASFFMTYVMTSGWASLSCELIQPFGLLYMFFNIYFCRKKDESSYEPYTFPYQTELPRVLLFLLLGFTCSVLAPLMLPLLLVYFLLAYLIYRNQFLNVYITRYNTGGRYWLLAQNTIIFSLVLMQVIAITVFLLKQSKGAGGLTVLIVIGTLIFNWYCRVKFYPVFVTNPAEVLIEMDRQDEAHGRLEEIHQQVLSAYDQFKLLCDASCSSEHQNDHAKNVNGEDMIQNGEDKTPALPQTDLP